MSKREHEPEAWQGLTTKEVARLRAVHGKNVQSHRKTSALWLQLLETIRNPLVLLLVGASVATAYFGDIRSCITILAMVAMSTLLDAYNVAKSDRAAEKLKAKVQVTSHVLRDGKETEVTTAEIVPGDVVLLAVGDIIPADGEVLASTSCFTNESSLTGESFPVAKPVGATVFMGSSVSAGEAVMRVLATGEETKFSEVVKGLSVSKDRTEFDIEVSSIGALILKVTILLCIFVFAVVLVGKGNLLQSLLFAVALAVGMTPEMMPMIIAINLSRGSLAMAKRGVIVKRLSSIQNFGSMNVLCTDKTGTLTEDSVALIKHISTTGEESEEVFTLAYLNSYFSRGFHSPLDDAIREHKKLSVSTYEKVAEIPYDFMRKRESVVLNHVGTAKLITKGAPEEILVHATHYNEKGKMHRLTDKHRLAIEGLYEKLSRGGYRVLAVATRLVGTKTEYDIEDEKDLCVAGFVAFIDPPKQDVEKTLALMAEHGVAVKILTGDSELVSARIAREINLEITGVITGKELAKLTDAALTKALHTTNLFARVSPDQKLRIITQLRKAGNVVGYIGDGINDAPSLKAADVGISVSNATDIAKESADMIMVGKDLHYLINAVIEGRKTFVNTLKYLMMSLSSNFGNMLSMAVAAAFLPFLPMLPAQVLLNNFLYDTSQFFLPFDSVDAEELRKPRKLQIQMVKLYMVVFGLASSLFDCLAFLVLLYVLSMSGAEFQTAWFIESLATQILVVFVIRSKLIPFIESKPSWYLSIGIVTCLSIGLLIAVTSIGTFFGFAAISLNALAVIAVLVVLYLGLVQLVKLPFYSYLRTKVMVGM